MSKSIATSGSQNDGFVGDIVTSALTEAQFQAQRNGTWVLMDGRTVSGSRYAAITGTTAIPDARGIFLRGKNNGRSDGNQNPDGEVALGTYQADDNKAHTHSATGGGGGSFPVYGENSVPGAKVAGNDGSGGQTGTISVGGGSVTILSSGTEARPRNVTVNYFIKIN